LGVKCSVFKKFCAVTYVWVHGAVERASEEFALGVECGVDGSCEAVWEGLLVGYFEWARPSSRL
jgi:hypothetical protein